jgi:glycosyltransferase involved in cell wall biosynthesis
MISVVIPLYNKEETILKAICSVLNQTYQSFKIIIINDGSTDNGLKLVKELNNNKIKIIDQKNAGVSAARNRGVLEAETDLIAFLDADDLWTKDFLATIKQLKTDYPECSVFGTGYSYLDPDGSKRLPIFHGLSDAPWHGVIKNYFSIASKSDPPLCSSAIAVNRTALLSVGLFPEGIKSGEDLLTWARLAVKYSIAYNSTICAFFRQQKTVDKLPTRIPDMPDLVGEELNNLLISMHQRKNSSFKHYLAWWHKNRASMYLRLGFRMKALKEVFKMGYYHINKKLILYLIISLMPKSLIIKAFQYNKSK